MDEASDREFLRQTLKRAANAADEGERPFAALLAAGGESLETASNTAERDGNPLKHAEMNLLQDVIGRIERETIADATLYASAEPCPMCATAMYYSGVTRLVFSVSNARLRSLLGPGVQLTCRDVFRQVPADIEVIGPLLEDEGSELIRSSEYGRPDT